MKKLLFSGLVLAAALVAFAVGGPRASAAAEEQADAKTMFVDPHKCNMCHSVAAAEIPAKTKSEKLKGPDLSGYKAEVEFAQIAAYARKEAKIDGKTHKREFKGSDEELQAILDWLGSLEAQGGE